MNTKSLLSLFAGLILVFGAIVAAIVIIAPYFSDYASSDRSDAITDDNDDDGFPEIDWEALQSENPNVVGWVRVEGTAIDYPIVQASKEDPDFYLSHGFDNSKSVYGIPYVASDCDGLNGYMSIVYGHNMINGSMFADFTKYTDQTYFDEHKQILLMTPTKNRRLDAVCAKEVSANNEFPRVDFTGADELSDYLISQTTTSSALGRIPSHTSKVFEFVSCSYGVKNGRSLIYAVEPASAETLYEGSAL